MGHDHAKGVVATDRKLAISTTLTLLFVLFEIGAWLYSNSLSLLGDAFHNFTDALALGIALLALYVSRRPATGAKTYGYQRAGILAAFLNAASLLGLTGYLLYESWKRFLAPQPVDSGVMIGVSIAALVLNTFITLWLREEGRHDVNVQSAVVHMFGDALSSVGILIGALVIRYTGALVVDPFVSTLIALLILWSSWGILRETVNLLLDGTPRGLDPAAVVLDLGKEAGVLGVHHLHIWALGPSRPALSCHLMLGDVSLRSAGDVLEAVNEMLARRYGITHTTIQVEYAACPLDDPFCIPVEDHVHDELVHR
jgi:cobalt-zinc-cadmium efflux system protein